LLNKQAIALDLEKLCNQARREGVQVAVAMADVDHFKEYNDYFGHVQGDQCLRSVATALEGSTKRPLDKAGRYGGEEFILIWYNCTAEDARQLGEDARDAVEALQIRHGSGASQRTVTVSVGIASTDSGEPIDSGSLIRTADRALYYAKANGRNRVELAGPGDFEPHSNLSARRLND
jgi:diguanylate cyclase (GGDEF)-like protein